MRSSKRVRLGEPVLLALCLLGLLSAPAWAAESPPAPEPAPPSATSPGGGESPAPESVPQASAPAPAGSSHAAPRAAEAGGATQSTPTRPAVGRTPSRRGAPTRRTSAQRGVQARRARKRAPARSGPSTIAAPTASPVSSHPNRTLMLLASLALGLLVLAGVTLLRLLIRLGRLSEGELTT